MRLNKNKYSKFWNPENILYFYTVVKSASVDNFLGTFTPVFLDNTNNIDSIFLQNILVTL